MFLQDSELETKDIHNFIMQAVSGAEHPKAPESNIFKPTSVIALFTPEDDTNLIFIQKADIEGYPWRNQMAFPGGNSELQDLSREFTALRELKEELDIPPEEVRVIGSIGHFQTINNRDIEAFLGIWEKTGDINSHITNILFDPSEISKIFNIPLSYLIKVHKDKNFAGRLPSVYELTYPYEDVVIWGVTAKIIHHLMEVIISRSATYDNKNYNKAM